MGLFLNFFLSEPIAEIANFFSVCYITCGFAILVQYILNLSARFAITHFQDIDLEMKVKTLEKEVPAYI